MKYLYNYLANNTNPASKSYAFRKKRFNLFINYLNVNKNDKILDVGGVESTWLGTGFEKNVTLLNIKFSSQRNPIFSYIESDACNMFFLKDNAYDIIYSNSVIEHLGSIDKQREFAKEVKRVGKKYWVQTPYKHFPIEPHLLFPFFQYFPPPIQRYIGMKWNYSHFKINDENILDEISRLRLLNLSDMHKLFPQSNVIKEIYFGIVKSIIAYKL